VYNNQKKDIKFFVFEFVLRGRSLHQMQLNIRNSDALKWNVAVCVFFGIIAWLEGSANKVGGTCYGAMTWKLDVWENGSCVPKWLEILVGRWNPKPINIMTIIKLKSQLFFKGVIWLHKKHLSIHHLGF